MNALRTHLARQLGCSPIVVDRLAAALAVANGAIANGTISKGVEDGSSAALDPRVDAFDGGPALAPALSILSEREKTVPPNTDRQDAMLAMAVGVGHRILSEMLDARPDDMCAVLADLLTRGAQAGRSGAPGPRALGAIEIPIATRLDGSLVRWTINQEQGSQTNANTRIVGQPGMGKTQFLKHLLACLNQHTDAGGLLLLDYKGDMAADAAFCAAAGATVVRPERDPLPINPFSVPAQLDARLVAPVIAENIAALGKGIGDVQRRLLRIGISDAFAEHDQPSAVDIANAVRETYESESRSPDSVISLLEQLADLNLFATHDAIPFEAFAQGRYIVDLSGLQTLRDLVAFALLDWFARQAESSPDAAFEDGHRRLRATVAIDEAHHYIRRNSLPLLKLLRIGRSKGLPVILSSQSLEDFRGTTELEEFLPTTFVMRQGALPDNRTLQGALRLPPEAIASARNLTTTISQFEALVCLQDVPAGTRVRLLPFFETHWT